MPLLLALLLAACTDGPGNAPAPPPEVTAIEAPPAAPPAELFRVVVVVDDDLATGVRAYDDGTVEQGSGPPDALAWRSTRRLLPADLDTLREILASEELARVPDVLPAPPEAGGPSATWRFLVPDPEGGPARQRTIRSSAYLAVRVPALQRVEGLVGATGPTAAVHARWTVRAPDGGTVAVELPCDPLRVPELHRVVTALHAPRLASADPAWATGEPLLRADFAAGTRAWRTTLLPDGLVVRQDETGARTAGRIPREDLPSVRAMVAEIPWRDLSCP